MRRLTIARELSPSRPALPLVFIFFSLSFSVALSETVSPDLLEQRRLQQQEIDKEAERRLQFRPEKTQPKIEMLEKIPLLPVGTCQTIRKIWLYGADQLSDDERAGLFAQYLGKCLDNDQLNRVARDIQKWYLDNGYITTRVRIKTPQDSLDRGNFEIWVFEGRIGDIRTDIDTVFDRRRIRSAFPVRPGDVLNIRDLDQGLEQLNRLFSQTFRMRIQPSERPGFSDVILTEIRRHPDSETRRHKGRQKLDYQLNNSGISATGEILHQLELNKENLIGYNDSMMAAWQRNLDYDPDNRISETWRFTASMPWGYNLFQLDYYQGETLRTIFGSNIAFTSSNRIRTTRLSASRVIRRRQDRKVEANTTIEYSKRESFINDTMVEVSSRDIASIDLGLVLTRYFKSSSLILSGSLTQGVSWFGARSDPDNRPPDSPSAEYTLIKLYGYYNKNFSSKRNSTASFLSAITAQYSNLPLYGEKQIVVGGEYSVRGYKENVATGDDGWYIRNDLIVAPGRESNHSVFSSLRLRIFFDVGAAHDKISGRNILLSGSGLGLEYTNRWLSARISAAKPLTASSGFDYENKWIHYASIGANVIF